MQEPWLRGAITGIPPLLQPVAHALKQAEEDVESIMHNFDDKLLWIKPAGRASVAFHLQHICGVTDRIMTYARAEILSEKQLDDLSDEGRQFSDITSAYLVSKINQQIGLILTQLKNTGENSFTEVRFVGRKKIPSTVIGLLFHAAEHVQRHVGQLLVTVSVVKNGFSSKL